jgi:hypothetical protein
MKLYQFDLTNIVDDLALMTDSVSNDVRKTQKTLDLRNRIIGKGTFSPTKDKKIWETTIKA